MKHQTWNNGSKTTQQMLLLAMLAVDVSGIFPGAGWAICPAADEAVTSEYSRDGRAVAVSGRPR